MVWFSFLTINKTLIMDKKIELTSVEIEYIIDLIETENETEKYTDYKRGVVDSLVKKLTIPNIKVSVCYCYNKKCIRHKGVFCMAIAFKCEDRQTKL